MYCMKKKSVYGDPRLTQSCTTTNSDTLTPELLHYYCIKKVIQQFCITQQNVKKESHLAVYRFNDDQSYIACRHEHNSVINTYDKLQDIGTVLNICDVMKKFLCGIGNPFQVK